MFVTWEALFLFCSLLATVIGLVININKKK